MKLVIIEAPYQADTELFTAYLRDCIRDSLARDESPINSVATFVSTDALDDDDQDERREGIAAGLEWYSVAEGCVAYCDHGISAGMKQGIAAARSMKVPVEYRRLFPQQEAT